MNSTGIFVTYSLRVILTTVIAFFIQSVSSQDIAPQFGNIKCNQTDVSIECSGIQTNLWEAEETLYMANYSQMENVILKISNLRFDPYFTFENTSIRKLTLGYNFEIPSSNFFSGSTSLVSLNLQDNTIWNIDDQLFSSLSSLKELFLDRNDLHHLSSNMFANLINLNYLSVTRNKFHEIKPDVFQNLSALETLILSHNDISSLKNLRINSESLTVLETIGCSIKGELEKDTFSGIPKLDYLDMSQNKLSEVKPHSLSTLKNLKFLNLSYNSIHRLHENAFSEMRNLTSLDLRGNGISVINLTSFSSLRNVKYLDLSENKLTGVFCEYTTDFDSLERIYLKDNKIRIFTQGAFSYSPHLKVLDIRGNNLECSCPLIDMVHHLIENSSVKRDDLESIFCTIQSTNSSVYIKDYKGSKCALQDPCKKRDYTNIKISVDTGTSRATDVSRTGSTTFSTRTVTTTHVTATENSVVSIFNNINVSDIVLERTTVSIATLGLSCPSLDLSVHPFSPDSQIMVFRNFSYDGSTFCLKWTIAGNNEMVKRCVLKYVTERGTKSKYIKCPSVPNEIQILEYDEKVFKFCFYIYARKKFSFCNDTISRTTTASTADLIPAVVTLSQKSRETVGLIETSTYSAILSSGSYSPTTTEEKVTGLALSTFESSSMFDPTVARLSTEVTSSIPAYSTSHETTAVGTDSVRINIKPGSNYSGFHISSVKVHFNNSNQAFAMWSVNTEQPLHTCNLTLKVTTTQNLNHTEGIFPCKNYSHEIKGVAGEILQICIVNHRENGGEDGKCKAFPSTNCTDNSFNVYLLIFICLLLFLGIVALFIIFKNMYKRKNESNEYPLLHTEEEKSKYTQMVETKPLSSNDLFDDVSCMAGENTDVV